MFAFNLVNDIETKTTVIITIDTCECRINRFDSYAMLLMLLISELLLVARADIY